MTPEISIGLAVMTVLKINLLKAYARPLPETEGNGIKPFFPPASCRW